MLTFPQITNWHIRPFTSYRFLERQYVDDFLDHGQIRLSSFSKFRQHKDEIRGDKSEGSGFYLANHKPDEGDGHHFSALMNTGKNAYVLSLTLRNELARFGDCNYDAGFVIKDIFGFAVEISRAIPFFIGGMQGQCFYKDPPRILIDLGEFNLNDLTPDEIKNKHNEFFEKTNMDNDIFFIKHLSHKDEEEYRVIWFADQTEEYIDLVCPKAIQFCERV